MGEAAKPTRLPNNKNAPKEPRQVKPRRRRGWKQNLLLLLLLLVASGGAAAGALYWQFNQIVEDVSQPTPNDGVATVKPGLSTVYEPDKSISLLIIGRDTRKNGGGLNTDVMLLATINPVNKKVTMLSIPRDTRIKLAGTSGYEKINSVYALGENQKKRAEQKGQKPTENGITLLKSTFEDVFGIPVQYYAEVDFKGFQAIIDELGGVQVNVDRKLVYDDPTDGTHINLSPGLQVLDGDKALDYVRHRHDNRGAKYESSDFDRNRRQQEVIHAIVDKMTTIDGMTKILDIMKIAGDHLRTDMPPDKIKGVLKDFAGVNSSAINALENGAYWVGGPNMNYTFFPNDKLASIRTALQTEMNIKPETLGPLNDSVSLGANEKTRPVATPPKQTQTTTTKPEVKQPSVEQQPAEPTKKPSGKPSAPSTNTGKEQQPADMGGGTPTPEPPSGAEQPPADYAPQTPSTDPATPAAPPADYADPTNQG
ncbi:LCP family protein [Brevibacillus fluminis]|uniref:LCP family protein n=1 Tax=Brevibacillus fluminis TaxID=511487 RepID=UPI003F8B1AD8